VPPEFIVVQVRVCWSGLRPLLTKSQNPPSIPTLALVQLVGRIRGSKVIIDWHNLGYSILALKLGKSHVLVRIAKRWGLACPSPPWNVHLMLTLPSQLRSNIRIFSLCTFIRHTCNARLSCERVGFTVSELLHILLALYMN
jgi:hypothetical protein